MFFDQAGAEGDGGDGRGGAEGVVGQPGNGAEAARQFRHLAKVRLVHRSGVGADAVEQRRSLAPASRAVVTASSISASLAMPVERIMGLPVLSRIAVERQVNDLQKRGDLVGWGVQALSRSTAVSSNGVENTVIPRLRAWSKSSLCHS